MNLHTYIYKWVFGWVTPKELNELKAHIEAAPEKEIKTALESIWHDPQVGLPMPSSDKHEVLNHLSQTANRTPRVNLWWRVAAAVLLPVLLIWGGYEIGQNNTNVAELTVSTAPGQKSQVVLPDGSKVWLNAESTMTYPTDFGKKNRSIKLVGEGYFEVKHNPNVQFSVQTDVLNVVVHGTTFNVAAHPHSTTVNISLLEGSVAVKSSNNQLLSMLKPNQTMKVNRTDLHFTTTKDDASLVSLWHLDMCRVENATADEVFKQMEYWYGMKINVEKTNSSYRYGFTIKSESIRELLDLMNELTPLEYSIAGEEVTIRYK